MIATRIHCRQDDVERLLQAELTNREIARRLHLDRGTVGKIRRHLGYPAAPHQPLPAMTLAEKHAESTTEVRGGHLLWTGPRTHDGTAVLKHEGHQRTARQVAYFLEHGEWPTGRLLPNCGQRWCVALDHCDDTATRQAEREALRACVGLPERPAECVNEHDQAVHGRYTPDGRSYCELCKTERRHAA